MLLVLTEGAVHGYGIVKRMSGSDAGAIKLAPSNIYHVLDRMIAAGLVEEVPREAPDPDGVRRRYYGITRLGRAVAAAEASRLDEVVRTAARLRLLPESGS